MRQKSVLQYFQKGFRLTTKSLDIYLLKLLLVAPVYFLRFAHWNPILLLGLYCLFTYLTLSFVLIVPILLIQKQQNKALNYKKIVRMVLKSMDRFLAPFVVIFASAVFLLVLIGILLISFFHIKLDPLQIFLPNWRIVYYVFVSLIYSCFEFTGIYFSLENKGIFASWKKSIKVSFKNPQFLLGIIFINLVNYLTLSIIPVQTFSVLHLLSLVTTYMPLILTSSCLYYYQEVIKE